MKGIYLILGSNLGDKFLSVQRATNLIRKMIGEVEAESSIYDTEPWGYEKQPNYLNKVIKLNTTLPPDELLQKINSIENEFGRKRKEKWHERILDVDILYYQDRVIKTGDLEIPHPQIANRRFALIPLCEIAPEEKHPVTGKTQKQMLEECNDTLQVNKMWKK
jgi:2-amino-4-hydroxy-6-hydroxymethyldihydropteridine diphosphokinase